jgi:SAM-dependent methyltransferase
MVNEKWYEKFFEGSFADVQRNFFSEEDTGAEAELIIRALKLKPGDKVLDAPCGPGRLTMALAEYGCRMTGIDITEPFLDDCRRLAAQRNLEVSLEKCDMRQISYKEEFDAAICMGGSFGYFDDNDNLNYLKCVAGALKPNGQLMMMVHLAESLFPKYRKQDFIKLGEIVVLDERSYNLEASRIESRWTIIRKDSTTVEHSSMRIYTFRQLCRMFRCVGFGTYEAYGSVEGEKFEFGSPRAYMVAIKNLA